MKKLVAELVGTFWLVFCVCGAALLAAGFPEVGIGHLGVALAVGLAVMTMAYAVGPVSGGHFNPAVSVGMVIGGRLPVSELPGYILAQVCGAVLAAGVIYFIASVTPAFQAGNFASNGYGPLSPGGYSLAAAVTIEIVMTAFFVFIILATTSDKSTSAFAPIAIGLALTLVHLVAIPVTNASVNPARSTGTALFSDSGALEQLWVFWTAPLIGGTLGAGLHRIVQGKAASEPQTADAKAAAGRKYSGRGANGGGRRK